MSSSHQVKPRAVIVVWVEIRRAVSVPVEMRPNLLAETFFAPNRNFDFSAHFFGAALLVAGRTARRQGTCVHESETNKRDIELWLGGELVVWHGPGGLLQYCMCRFLLQLKKICLSKNQEGLKFFIYLSRYLDVTYLVYCLLAVHRKRAATGSIVMPSVARPTMPDGNAFSARWGKCIPPHSQYRKILR